MIRAVLTKRVRSYLIMRNKLSMFVFLVSIAVLIVLILIFAGFAAMALCLIRGTSAVRYLELNYHLMFSSFSSVITFVFDR